MVIQPAPLFDRLVTDHGLAKSARHQQTNKTQNHDAINAEIRAGSIVVTEL